MRRPKPNQEAIAAALQAMQRLTMKMDSETAVEETAPQNAALDCLSCRADITIAKATSSVACADFHGTASSKRSSIASRISNRRLANCCQEREPLARKLLGQQESAQRFIHRRAPGPERITITTIIITTISREEWRPAFACAASQRSRERARGRPLAHRRGCQGRTHEPQRGCGSPSHAGMGFGLQYAATR